MKALIFSLIFASLAQAEVYQAAIKAMNSEVSETHGLVSFHVTLDRPSSAPFAINFQTKGHNAQAGLDFVPKTEILRFAPGEVLKIIEVMVIDDKTDEEAQELFQAEISSLTSDVLVTTPFAMVAINDDEEVFDIQNVKFTEPDEDEEEASLLLRREFPSKERVILQIHTEEQTAVSGEDYIPYFDQVVFEPAELEKTVAVKVLGDKKPELEEFFSLTIEGVSGEITLLNPLPMVRILDNDGQYAVRFRMSHESRASSTTFIQNYDSNIVALNHFESEEEEYFYSGDVTVDLEYFIVGHGAFDVIPGTFSIKKLTGVSDGQLNVEKISMHYVIGAKKSMCTFSGTPMRIQCPIEPIHGLIHSNERHPNDSRLPGINLVTGGFEEYSDISDGNIVVGKKTFSEVFPIPNPNVDDVRETMTIEILKIADEVN